jgi:F-type H+-transporting ATPase subunit b
MKRIAALLLGLALCLSPFALTQEVKAQEGNAQEEKKQGGGLSEPNLTWQSINFVLLVGLIAYFAVKKGGPFFNARAAEIRKGIDDAEKVKAESDAKVSAINNKLGRLDAEIASLRESAGAERRVAEQRLKEETQREIQRIAAHADAEMETAGKSERLALQRYAGQLALELAETKVRARMNPGTEDTLVQAFVRGLSVQEPRPQTQN